MLDGWMRRRIDSPLNAGGRWLAARGFSADQVTAGGLGLGLGAALVVALGGPFWAALGLMVLGRLADGLDGAVARAGKGGPGAGSGSAAGSGAGKSDGGLGGFHDIVADFAFYGALPLAFAVRSPENALPAAFLLAAFYVNGASFLAFAILAAKRGMETRAQGEKSLYFSAGLLEGTETILFFTACLIWPGAFPALAWVFGAMCLVTAGARVVLAGRVFGGRPDLDRN